MEYNKGDKFIFEILDAHTSLHENENYYSIKQTPYISFSETTLNKFEKIKEEKYRPSELEKFQQEAFEKGMEEAWEIARKLVLPPNDGGIDGESLIEIYYHNNYREILKTKTAQEVKNDFEKHFMFFVGDVVEKDGIRAIVLDFDGEFVSVWTENGCVECWTIEKVTKLDAHCDLKPILEFIGKRQ